MRSQLHSPPAVNAVKRFVRLTKLFERTGCEKGDMDHSDRPKRILSFETGFPDQETARVRILTAPKSPASSAAKQHLPTCKLENAVTDFSKTPAARYHPTPQDLRRLKVDQIRQVADELRQEPSMPSR